MDFIAGIVVGVVLGFAFRGVIGKEVAKIGTELKNEVAKLKEELSKIKI